MRKIIGLFVGIIMCLVVFSVLSGNAFGDLEKPTWSVGDKWEYNMTFTEGGMNGTMKMEVEGTTTITVNDTNYDVYMLEMSGSGTMSMSGMTGNWTMDGTGYLQQSDLAMVKTVMDMNMTMTMEYPSPGTYYMSSSNTTTYSPPLDENDFPISVGETWTATATATSTEETSSNMPYYPSGNTTSTTTETENYECLCTESVTVPAGTFNTYKIKSQEPGSNSYEIDYISSDVGFMVKSETYNETGQLSSTMELTSYSYAGPEEEEGGIGETLGKEVGGVSILYWLIIIVIILVVIVIALVALKRKKKAPIPPVPPQTPQP